MLFEEHRPALEFFLKLGGLTVAVVTLFFIYLQMQTIQSQTKEMKAQNEAIWYSSRPVLTIPPINPQQSIGPVPKSIKTPIQYESIREKFSRLSVVLKNVGRSPCLLDTVIYEVLTNGAYILDTQLFVGYFLATNGSVVDKMSIMIRKDYENLIRIRATYRWDTRPESKLESNFEFERYYVTSFKDSAWGIEVTTSTNYKSKLEQWKPEMIPGK